MKMVVRYLLIFLLVNKSILLLKFITMFKLKSYRRIYMYFYSQQTRFGSVRLRYWYESKSLFFLHSISMPRHFWLYVLRFSNLFYQLLDMSKRIIVQFLDETYTNLINLLLYKVIYSLSLIYWTKSIIKPK